MWNGPPKDVDGECNATLCIGDDYGDNCATMRCQLKPGHDGLHKETNNRFTVTWLSDDRESE